MQKINPRKFILLEKDLELLQWLVKILRRGIKVSGAGRIRMNRSGIRIDADE